MKILIYGAGVIGCLYASLFSKAGYDTNIYARGKRLESLNKKGLLYRKNNKIQKANVNVISQLKDDEFYDFIFLTVRENQLYVALEELKDNISPTIVTMVNSLDEYNKWEDICGKGRILPAFPGAGGSFNNDILDATLTPRIIQPTTFSEINGKKSRRIIELITIFKESKIPYQMVKDMHSWQLCHLAMVVPIANAYYEAKNPSKAGLEKEVMMKTAKQIKNNYRILRELGIELSPMKMNLFCYMPISILSLALSRTFMSKFGDKFMYQHSMKAPDEMRQLHEKFYNYIDNKIASKSKRESISDVKQNSRNNLKDINYNIEREKDTSIYEKKDKGDNMCREDVSEK